MKKIENNIPFKFVNETNGDEHVMLINGAIGVSDWFFDATSANDVRNALEGVTASTIRIKLNSGGGDVFQGIEIYNYLKELDAKVIVEVTALAASAASIIAMGADEIVMKNGATMMIHEASTMAYGNKADIQKTMNALEAIDESIVSIYKERTGMDAKKIEKLMQDETWFTAEEALEKGFADKIETVEEPQDEPQDRNEEFINSIVEKVTAQLKQQTNNEKDDKPKEPQPEKVAATTKRVVF